MNNFIKKKKKQEKEKENRTELVVFKLTIINEFETKMTFYSSSPSTRPKSLMEMLLAKKIEAASAQGSILGGGAGGPSKLFRCDSMDSVSSIGSLGSLILGDDVCRCDDCLLGIVDLWIAGPQEKALLKKKVIFATSIEVNGLKL